MHPTPSPRSISEAPAFFFTTPFDFFAAVTDQTPSGTSTGVNDDVRRSKYSLPDPALVESWYQVFAPEPSNFSTFGASGLPCFFMRATVASTPAASHSSNGPISQLKPSFIARSISTTVSL